MPSTQPIALTHLSRTTQRGRARIQRGATLLELIIALAIMSGIMTGLYQLVDTFNQNTKSAVVSQHMSTVGQAAQAYIKDNYAAVAAVATAGTPALIRVSTLIATNYLQNGFTTSNAYNQNVCVLVLQPAANQLAALVVAEGGTTIDDLTLGQIAATMGASGGGVYSTAATTLKGAMGGWSTAVGNFANANNLGLKCDGTAGNVTIAAGHPIQALWFANGDVTAGFLYRNSVPGRPELNQMQTALDMNNNALNNVATVALTTAVTQGDACTAGLVARDAAGAVMSCQGGTYQPQGSAYWKDPVANFAALPTCDAAAAWQTRVAQTPTTGTGARAYTCNGAGTWQALGIDNSGNITIAGTATINAMNGNLQVTATATDSTACAGEGRLAMSTVTSGLMLSCQSSVWKKASGTGGKAIATDVRSAFAGTTSRTVTLWLPTTGNTYFIVNSSMQVRVYTPSIPAGALFCTIPAGSSTCSGSVGLINGAVTLTHESLLLVEQVCIRYQIPDPPMNCMEYKFLPTGFPWIS
jgi:prepilin-type N-terminal cleavage/methylation domain-containing protein